LGGSARILDAERNLRRNEGKPSNYNNDRRESIRKLAPSAEAKNFQQHVCGGSARKACMSLTCKKAPHRRHLRREYLLN
jgi:hypothetical protein